MSKTILVVDSNSLIRHSLSAALVSNELAVETANNGKDGLALALDKKPDLIVTDLQMAKMDGLAMIAKIRKTSWGKKTPIIIMTVDEEPESINKALEFGVTTYISKKFSDPAAIVEQIRRTLG
jgi:CheY-like chemotaxis protein